MPTSPATEPGIEPGLLVRIAVPNRERATARVTHVASTWIALRLSDPQGPRAQDLQGRRAAVEYCGDEGMYRVLGEFDAVRGSSITLRFVLRSGPQFLGRRRHIRTALEAPVVLTAERGGEKIRGRSLNVSEGGMLVECTGVTLPRPGQRFRFALAPRTLRDPIGGSAVVTRADNGYGRLALNFDPLPRESADELARVVFENEQALRALRH